jgi:hypothetical protein
MPIKRRLIHNLLITAVLLLPAGIVHAAPPVLAQLQYLEGEKIKTAPIREQAGAVPSPAAGKPQTAWVLGSGDKRSGDAPPAERIIRFYHNVNNQPVLLCNVLVKYYPRDGKWEPAYHMQDRIVLMRDGASLKPIPAGTGDIGLTLMIGTSLPNVDGYYSSLQFGLPSRTVGIDAWEVN